MATAGAALRLRLLCRMLRVGELLALVVFLSWSTSRVPSAAAAVLRLAGSLLLDPRFVFLLGNAIVVLLFALSRHDLSLSSGHASATATATASAIPASAVPVASGFGSFTAPTTVPPPPPQGADVPVVEVAAAAAAAEPEVVVFPVPAAATAAEAEVEEKQQVVYAVNKARAPRRSRSEKMAGPRVGRLRAASPESMLRRSESENGRRRRSSVTARDAERCWGMDDADEFRRTVEAFIAKQTRFHREEHMTTAIVVPAAAPALAGALVVVE